MAEVITNPIISIQYSSSGDPTTVSTPSTFEYEIEDVSKADAGRTEDGTMNKNLLGQCVKLKLAWKNVTTDVASDILRKFNYEYMYITYLDPMVGGATKKQFYVGNRTSPLYNSSLQLWSNISFNLIERDLHIFKDGEWKNI